MVSAPTHAPRPANAAELRDLFDRFAGQVEAQVAAQVESAVQRAVTVAREAARREMAEELNQAVRRLRQCTGAEEILNVLPDAAAPFCYRAAVFSISDNTVRGAVVRGLESGDAVARFCAQEFPLPEAGAFANAVESRDPVIAAATPSEIGTLNVELFGHPADDRVYLFPVTARQQVLAILYATAGIRSVEIAPLELLSGAASALLGALIISDETADRKAGVPELIAIQPAAAETEVRPPDLSRLPEAEKEAHLRAQRLARVLVAEVRLYRPDAVRSGRTRRDLYGVLRSDIDRARENFRQTCFSACPSMVDYLHQELLRSLANDDVQLLGPSYPGPIRHEAIA